MQQLKVNELSLGYEGNVVISEITFAINSRDYLCIVGENGCGKSTLLKAMLGIIRPLAGQVTLPELYTNQIGYMPQQRSIRKDFPASVYEVVISGCANRSAWRPLYSREEKRMAGGYMERMGIADLAKRCFSDLSGGQQQRALLARALCAGSKALFLDEPVAGLDPLATEELYRLIHSLNDEGTTIIMVTHDPDALLQYASHVLHLSQRRIRFFGSSAAYLSSEAGRFFLQLEGRSV